MEMNDSRLFHEKASSFKPNDHVKPTTIWAGVLHAEKTPNDELSQADILWIKCPGKTSVETIKNQYEMRNKFTEKWFLKHDSKIAEPAATVAELNKKTYNDNVVVFEAVKTSDTSRFPARQPLHEADSQHTLNTSKDRSLPEKKPSLLFPNLRPYSQDENAVPPSYQSHTNFTKGAISRFDGAASASESPTVKAPSTQPNIPPERGGENNDCSGNKLMGQQMHSSMNFPSSNDVVQHQPSDNTSLTSLPGHNYPPRNSPYHSSQFSQKSRGEAGTSKIPPYGMLSPGSRGQEAVQSMTVSPGEASSQSPYAPHLRMSGKLSPDSATHSLAPFKMEEPRLSAAEIEEQKRKHFQLQTMLRDADPQMLEKSVEEGVKLLDDLKIPLVNKMSDSPDAEQWIQQIDRLKQQAVKTKTVIGVVGNTGAGKSSVINAMLEEERLVPTNCMRACTAVVTEISYNDGEKPYHAQIEFISVADWEKELRTLFADLLDGDGKVSRDCVHEDTDAGIAYAKIKAVYPRKTKEDIANSSIETMLREVGNTLGKTRDIEESDSLVFYKKLQSYVDSKEKTTGKDKDKKKEKREMEFWPLIRVVRIYVKSPALATGAVIADLPGVHDANAARAAVAEGYMKQCTGLWIVAPINRAVDDKAAKSLLGESFKRQLKMDGGFSAVTFICSKTDDISIQEAQDSLGLDDKMAPSWDEIDALRKRQKALKKQMEEFKDSKAVYDEVANDADEQMEIWQSLREDIGNGKLVFAPKPDFKHSKKRKAGRPRKAPKKKLKTSASGSDDDFEATDFEHGSSEEIDCDKESDEGQSDDDASRPDPLTEEQVVSKVQELRLTKRDARAEKAQIGEKLAALRKELSEANEAENNIESKQSKLCIEGRNWYSRGAIQQDFAAGIKEIDQELAAEEDEENFNPDAEVRDYEAVAHGLPVFCVSSRGYQKLQGRLRKDPPVPGFTSVEETEIPALQAHCEKLTERGRSANCQSFINKLSQLLNSLTLWASSDGTGANMTAEERAKEARYLQKGLKSLESGLEKAVATATNELRDEFSDNIFEKYETAVQNAVDASIETSYKWGMPVNRENRAAGGLHWSTYKAICRRNGIYSNAQGPHEWNVQLAEPLMKMIASGWEKCFSGRAPAVMVSFSRNSATGLKQFHRDIESRAQKVGSVIPGLSMLKEQMGVYEQILKDLSATVKDTIVTASKDINRAFPPVIEQAMQEAYDTCVAEHGTGSFSRMKAAMNSHVAHTRHSMFQQSADQVKRLLEDLAKQVETMMSEKTDDVFIQMQRDYRSVLGGGDTHRDGEILPRVQRLVRKEVMAMIEATEQRFMKVVRSSSGDQEGDQGSDEKQQSPGSAVKREVTPANQLQHDTEVAKDEPMDEPMDEASPKKSDDDDDDHTNRESVNKDEMGQDPSRSDSEISNAS